MLLKGEEEMKCTEIETTQKLTPKKQYMSYFGFSFFRVPFARMAFHTFCLKTRSLGSEKSCPNAVCVILT